jgi:hypothetical protein
LPQCILADLNAAVLADMPDPKTGERVFDNIIRKIEEAEIKTSTRRLHNGE